MKLTNEQVDAIIRRFLSEHPEHIPGVRHDPAHGPLLDTVAAKAFAKWSETNGGDPAKCKAFTTFLTTRPQGEGA